MAMTMATASKNSNRNGNGNGNNDNNNNNNQNEDNNSDDDDNNNEDRSCGGRWAGQHWLKAAARPAANLIFWKKMGELITLRELGCQMYVQKWIFFGAPVDGVEYFCGGKGMFLCFQEPCLWTPQAIK
jgi:hypothetical protein